MVLSRLARYLIRVYASQVAAAQPTAARSKLAGAGTRIETVRGVGYRIVAS
jgi:DNA-binding response OmpR family regulator